MGPWLQLLLLPAAAPDPPSDSPILLGMRLVQKEGRGQYPSLYQENFCKVHTTLLFTNFIGLMAAEDAGKCSLLTVALWLNMVVF